MLNGKERKKCVTLCRGIIIQRSHIHAEAKHSYPLRHTTTNTNINNNMICKKVTVKEKETNE